MHTGGGGGAERGRRERRYLGRRWDLLGGGSVYMSVIFAPACVHRFLPPQLHGTIYRAYDREHIEESEHSLFMVPDNWLTASVAF